MLDYNKLSSDFSNKLQQFDKDFLESWIAFDQEREVVNTLCRNETATFSSKLGKTKDVGGTENTSFEKNDMSNNFAMAA